MPMSMFTWMPMALPGCLWHPAGRRCPLHAYTYCSPEHRWIYSESIPGAQATGLRPFLLRVQYEEIRGEEC